MRWERGLEDAEDAKAELGLLATEDTVVGGDVEAGPGELPFWADRRKRNSGREGEGALISAQFSCLKMVDSVFAVRVVESSTRTPAQNVELANKPGLYCLLGKGLVMFPRPPRAASSVLPVQRAFYNALSLH